MASLADLLMVPAKHPTRMGPISKQDVMNDMMQQHPVDGMGQITEINPWVPDQRKVLPEMLNQYPQGRVPEHQQEQIAGARQFANMYNFVQKLKGSQADKITRLSALMSNMGIQPPTIGDLYGPQGAEELMPEEASQQISLEDYAKFILQDSTGEMFRDALSRVGR